MTAQQEHCFIAHQNIGNSFSGVYYIESVFVKKTKGNKDYLDLTLRDKSGSRFVKYWGVVDGLQKGDFAFIAANVEDYMGNPSIIAKNVEKADSPSDWSSYIPIYDDSDKYATSFDVIRAELKKLEEKTGDEMAGRIVDEVYGNATFFQKFIVSPGSAKPHYGRQGGLLANTVRITEQCLKMSESYSLNEQERVVLVASALLCRIGAIDAFEFQSCVPVETKKGMLIGMNNLTMARVSSALKRVISEMAKEGEQPNQETILRILHAISSCAGLPMKPMTKEALILVAAYRVDVDMVDAYEFMQNDVNVTEEFTAYDPSLGRRYYLGCRTPLA
jgi:3'-5' exoribonuclease